MAVKKTTPAKKPAKASSSEKFELPEGIKAEGDGATYTVVPRSYLKNAEYNPRDIDPVSARRLKENIERTKGLIDAPIWNKRTGNIVGGHQRVNQLDAIKGTKEYKLTVAVVDWPIEKEIEQNIALNNPSMQGDYNLTLLDDLLGRPDIELVNTGFDVTTLELMHNSQGLPLPEWMIPEEERESLQEYNEGVDELEDLSDEGEEAEAELEAEEEEARKIADIKKAKKDFSERQGFLHQDLVHCRLVFPTNGSKKFFMEKLNLPVDAEFIDGLELADKLDIRNEMDAVIEAEKPEAVKKSEENAKVRAEKKASKSPRKKSEDES